jgi:hypothetical protein
MNIGSRIDCRKWALAAGLLCSAFCFGAAAQTDQPLDAPALAALVAELKEVVAKNAPDARDSAAVAERWDRRKDLAGETKKAVIGLLFEDVRAVIKDSGVQYQIYSIFSFYKRMPDETQPPTSPRSGNMYEEPWQPAARFAVEAGGKKENAAVSLAKVEKANFQTGEDGLTFELCLAVEVKKGRKKAVKQYARATVFRNDATMNYMLLNWKLSKTPPVCR